MMNQPAQSRLRLSTYEDLFSRKGELDLPLNNHYACRRLAHGVRAASRKHKPGSGR